jgi:hypothetical protein
LRFDSAENRAVANRAIRAEEDEVVWEIGGRETEVGAWFFGPCILEVGAGGVYNGEAGLEGGVEAGGTDKYVDRVFVAVGAYAATFADGVDLAVDGLYVGFP